MEATCCCFLPRAWNTQSLQQSSASALGEHWGTQASRKTARTGKSHLLIRYLVTSARGDSLPCCPQQHFPLPLLCVHMGSCRKCSFCRDSAPSPMALDKPRNVPLSYFLLLTGRLTGNIDSAMRLENPTYWNLGNQACNSESSTIYREITSLFLSLAICHWGYTPVDMYWGEQGRRGAKFTHHNAQSSWPQSAPKSTKHCQEDRVCFVWPRKTIHVVIATVGWSHLEDLIKLSMWRARGKRPKAVRRHSKLTYRG